jgi:hypothetical protein
MIIVNPVPTQAYTPLRHGSDYGWVHACGHFTFCPVRPNGCGPCHSVLSTVKAHPDAWTLVYIATGDPS